MPVLIQIALGSFILLACTLMQIMVIGWVVRHFRKRGDFANAEKADTVRKVSKISSIALIPLLACHTAHVYIWAISVWLLGALPGYEEPIYFTLVTYTTVGYGDVTLPSNFRIFGAMASVNGILSFGLTTAFLVGLFSSVLKSLRD